jgi:PAS domain S-box-containing protein
LAATEIHSSAARSAADEGSARRSASEARLELATQAAQIGIWDWDLETNAFVYTAIARTICGLPEVGDITYDDVVRLTYPEDLPRTLALMERALDPKIRDDSPYEYRVLRPDGAVRWVLAHGQPVFEVRNGALRAVRYVGTLQDITERRRLEEVNRAFAERLRFAMVAGRLGSFQYESRTAAMTFDGAQLEIFGLTPQAVPLTENDVWAIVHPQDLENLRRLVDETYNSGGANSAEFRIVRPDGEVRWLAGNAATIRNEAGERTHLFGYTADITERRRTEDALAERQAILQSLLDAAELFIGVVEIMPHGIDYILANRATVEFYGMPQGRDRVSASELGFSNLEIANWRAFLMGVVEGRAPRTLEYPFLGGGNGEGWYLGTYSPLPPGPEGLPRLSFVVVDITSRKLADDRQQLLMREVDHRAKNALAVAQAVVQLTKESDPAAFKEAVVGRVAAIARTHSLLADGRWTGVDLGRLVNEELAPFATDKASRLQADGPAYSLDPSAAQLVGLIVHELATNAVKYGALKGLEGGLVVTWTIDRVGALHLTWIESGPVAPIPPDRQGFGFRLLDQTISRQLGGEWSADWSAPGLRFEMTLPLQRSEVEPASARPPLPLPSPLPSTAAAVRTAMIIEDEPLIALELEARLEDLGFVVTERCSSLSEAYALVRAGAAPNLAVLDVNLGGETTFRLGLDLKYRGARVVFSTGYAEVDLPEGLAGSPVLVKPVTREALAAAVAGSGR